jgi:hypothetical protein
MRSDAVRSRRRPDWRRRDVLLLEHDAEVDVRGVARRRRQRLPRSRARGVRGTACGRCDCIWCGRSRVLLVVGDYRCKNVDERSAAARRSHARLTLDFSSSSLDAFGSNDLRAIRLYPPAAPDRLAAVTQYTRVSAQRSEYTRVNDRHILLCSPRPENVTSIHMRERSSEECKLPLRCLDKRLPRDT